MKDLSKNISIKNNKKISIKVQVVDNTLKKKKNQLRFNIVNF